MTRTLSSMKICCANRLSIFRLCNDLCEFGVRPVWDVPPEEDEDDFDERMSFHHFCFVVFSISCLTVSVGFVATRTIEHRRIFPDESRDKSVKCVGTSTIRLRVGIRSKLLFKFGIVTANKDSMSNLLSRVLQE